MRTSGDAPAFDRIIEEVQDAKVEWLMGNRGKAERMLRLAASIAIAESNEQRPGEPLPKWATP